VLLKNKNKHKDVIEQINKYEKPIRTYEEATILSASEYVWAESVDIHSADFGGSQWTVKRARRSQKISTDETEKLEGLLLVTGNVLRGRGREINHTPRGKPRDLFPRTGKSHRSGFTTL
jgi:hypothetical protein